MKQIVVKLAVKRAVLATGAALILAVTALATSITSADAKDPGRSGAAWHGAGNPGAFKSGSSGPHVGMSGNSNFRSAAGAQFRSGQVSRQFNGAPPISRQYKQSGA